MSAGIVHGEIIPACRPEWLLPPQERAEMRDRYVAEFEQQFGWADIARVCMDFRRDKDYLILGYKSYDAWLNVRAPRSSSFIRRAVDHYKTLSPDIPDEQLSEMSLASATLLKGVSPNVRRDPKVQKAAQGKTKELRQTIMTTHPEQHLENVVKPRLKFSFSAWNKIQDAYEAYQMVEPSATIETFLEFIISEWQLAQPERS